ncbi:MAG: Ig-like domain-containing protein, partial [Verrucomicrobiota bacterium]
ADSAAFNWTVQGVDTTRPTLTLSTSSSSVNGPFSVSAQFSENVSGFQLGDVSIGNGSGSGFSGSGASYAFTVTPSNEGSVTVAVGSGRAQDGSGNTNTASNTLTVTYTDPANSGGGADEYTVDAETIALYHFNGNYNDASGNGLNLQALGGVQRVSSNLGWMANPSGQVARFTSAGDRLTIAIPDSLIMPSGGAPLTIEARIFPRAYKGYSVGNLPIVSLEQSWDSGVTLKDNKWAKNPKGPSLRTHNTELLSRQQWQAEAAFGQWHLIQVAFDGNNTVRCWIDGELVRTVNRKPNFSRTNNWILTLGNFDGDIDEVLIRQSPDPAETGPPPPDLTPPGITLSQSSNQVSGPYTVTATTTEAVIGFSGSDIQVSNGSVSQFGGSGSAFNFTVTPQNEGTVTVSVAAGRFTDPAGNPNTASNALSTTYVESTGGGSGDEFSVDGNTVALYHLNDNTNDASPNGLNLSLTGGVQLTAANLGWMSDPAGKVARFTAAGQRLTVSIPDSIVLPGSGTPLTVDARIFPRAYKGYSVGNLPIVSLVQNWDTGLQLRDNKWNSNRAPSVRAGNVEMVSAADWKSAVSLNQWHRLQMVFDGGNTISCYLDGVLLSSVIKTPNYSRTNNWTFTLGNFDGDIDEVLISNAVPSGLGGQQIAGQATRASVQNLQSDVQDYPNTWNEWIILVGSDGSLTANPDGDDYPDFLEYALGEPRDSGQYRFGGFRIERQGGVQQAVFERPYSIGDVRYTMEASSDGEVWFDVPDGPLFTHRFDADGIETVRFDDLQAVSGAGMNRGFVRLRVELEGSSERMWTPVNAWFRLPLQAGYQTVGVSVMNPPLASGRIVGVEDGRIDIAESNLVSTMSPGMAAFVEIRSGRYEGHRFDLAGVSGSLLEVVSGSPGNTLEEVPSDLAGSRYVVRLHHTLESLFPRDTLAGGRAPELADQVHFYRDGRYESYFFLQANEEWSRWVAMGNASLDDAGSKLIRPGEGVFLNRSRQQRVEWLGGGQVRTNAFVQRLRKGYNLVSEGYPVAATPLDRKLTETNGFLADSDPVRADQIQVWLGDQIHGAGFKGYFLMPGVGSDPAQWSGIGDALLGNQNETLLFQPDRAVFLHLGTTDHPFYRIRSGQNDRE